MVADLNSSLHAPMHSTKSDSFSQLLPKRSSGDPSLTNYFQLIHNESPNSGLAGAMIPEVTERAITSSSVDVSSPSISLLEDQEEVPKSGLVLCPDDIKNVSTPARRNRDSLSISMTEDTDTDFIIVEGVVQRYGKDFNTVDSIEDLQAFIAEQRRFLETAPRGSSLSYSIELEIKSLQSRLLIAKEQLKTGWCGPIQTGHLPIVHLFHVLKPVFSDVASGSCHICSKRAKLVAGVNSKNDDTLFQCMGCNAFLHRKCYSELKQECVVARVRHMMYQEQILPGTRFSI